jgi:hypothetical protein
MDSNNDYLEKLKSFGIDPDNLPKVTEEELLDIPRRSMERFVARQTGDVRTLSSHGFIRLFGGSVVDHTVALDAAGSILTSLQKSVTNFGAALSGNKTIRGALPSSLSERTQLLLTASPQPGSIVFTLSPEAPGYDELYPQPALFQNENSPLADQAMKGILELLSEIDTTSPDASDEFVSHLDNLGPRFTQSFGELLGELSINRMDTEMVWNEPGHEAKRISVAHETAGYAKKLIADLKLDIEEMMLVGTLRTISDIKKLDLQIDNGELVTIERGDISDTTMAQYHIGQHVEVVVELSSGTKTGGKPVRKYKARSINADEAPRETDSLFPPT